MCDTIAIVEGGRVLFAKNSDRNANEGQNLVWNGRGRNAPGAGVKCTWIEIPEVEETHATLLSRPFWIWGAEMGTNEHGVTIGNEAVFTKAPKEPEAGLIGMDLLRLGLERAATAKEAVEVIVSLLEQHGQGGGCGLNNPEFTYDNSFIVADPAEAYVLETAGRESATSKISGARSISNGLTIPEFHAKHSDFVVTHFSGCDMRQPRTQSLADDAATVADMIRILQDHGKGRTDPHYAFTHGGLHAPCVHAGGALVSSQTTASWVSELRPGDCRHWATGTAAPCTGLFKPVAVDTPVDIEASGERAHDSLWWRHERLHRAVTRNPRELMSLFISERADVQARWFEDPPESAAAFAEADALLAEWTRAVDARAVQDVRPLWTRRYWKAQNEKAGLVLGAGTLSSEEATASP